MLVHVISLSHTRFIRFHHFPVTSSHFISLCHHGCRMLQVLRPLWDAVSRSKLHGPRWPRWPCIDAALNITEPLSAQASGIISSPGQVAGITFVIREITIDKVGSTSCFTTGNEKVQLCQHQWEGPYSFNLSKWHNTVHTVEGQQTPFDT